MADIADAGKCWLRSRMTGRVELLVADGQGNWRPTVDIPRDQPFSLVIDPVAQTAAPRVTGE